MWPTNKKPYFVHNRAKILNPGFFTFIHWPLCGNLVHLLSYLELKMQSWRVELSVKKTVMVLELQEKHNPYIWHFVFQEPDKVPRNPVPYLKALINNINHFQGFDVLAIIHV